MKNYLLAVVLCGCSMAAVAKYDQNGEWIKQWGEFGSGAGQLACPNENEIYAAETANWRVQKLLLK